MAPVSYSKLWSNRPTMKSLLGRVGSEDEVIPFRPFLDDDVDLGGPNLVYYSQPTAAISQLMRVYAILIFVLIIFPVLIIKLVRKCL